MQIPTPSTLSFENMKKQHKKTVTTLDDLEGKNWPSLINCINQTKHKFKSIYIQNKRRTEYLCTVCKFTYATEPEKTEGLEPIGKLSIHIPSSGEFYDCQNCQDNHPEEHDYMLRNTINQIIERLNFLMDNRR